MNMGKPRVTTLMLLDERFAVLETVHRMRALTP
jgi:hypothetical protein